ncbi:MAG: RNA polymerase sigma factor SigJ [Candidatus Dormibacteraeota bacterium]|nr:RNA polymerase sigma factor SigJ [Candidatus Dormibacteraeota bacterium]
MSSRRSPSETFEAYRPVLVRAAYGMLGSWADAEDVVQETWLRWSRVDTDGVRDARAYLLRATHRQALNRLRAERTRRETYVGPWLPEPLVSRDDPALAVTERAERAERLTLALLVVLETLSPEERCAFLLREVFDAPYAEIAATLERTEPATRQLVHRARERVRQGRPRFPADRATQERVTSAFVEATLSGDTTTLTSLLAPGAVALSDGGGKVLAARNPIRGADRVARFMAGLGRTLATEGGGETMTPAYVNGVLGVVGEHEGRLTFVGVLDVADGLIRAVHIVVNPEKLAHVRRG